MQLNEIELIELAELAIDAAIRAGDLISLFEGRLLLFHEKNQTSYTDNKFQADHPSAPQIVTEVDLKSQSLIYETLLPSLADYDLGLLAEESEDDCSRLKKDFFWAIDPLDGTLHFSEGKAGYSVAIALVNRQGVPHIGVVYDPVNATLYHAIKGMGAFRNDFSFNPAPPDDHAALSLIHDRSFGLQVLYDDIIEALEAAAGDLGYQGFHSYEFGGSVMNAISVLEKNPAAFFKFPQSRPGGGCIWDFAATTCIYNETGAFATDIGGAALRLNDPDTCYLNRGGVVFTGARAVQQRICSLYKELHANAAQTISQTG